MPVHDDLGIRMKECYEAIPKTKLMRKVPVAIRLDGKAFHTFTKGMKRPFDEVLINTMQRTMQYLCENIQGCVFGYTQSDEITLILIDYKKQNSSAWFDYEVQKMCSVAASMATMAFNKFFADEIQLFKFHSAGKYLTGEGDKDLAYEKRLENAAARGAMFDARCFNIPKEEVGNLLYWRQLDATRNSIQMVGQANFSHKELQHKSCNDIQNMLYTEKDINWNDFPPYLKRGTCCYKTVIFMQEDEDADPYMRTKWYIDPMTPIFKDDWDYINRHIFLQEKLD